MPCRYCFKWGIFSYNCFVANIGSFAYRGEVPFLSASVQYTCGVLFTRVLLRAIGCVACTLHTHRRQGFNTLVLSYSYRE